MIGSHRRRAPHAWALRPIIRTALFITLMGPGVEEASAQERPVPSPVPREQTRIARDTTQVIKALQSRQQRFERFRRRHLRWTYRGVSRCDERIGRYCFDFTDSEWTPPEEASEVVAARQILIAGLDSAAVLIPSNGWIAGQRVRYLGEAGLTTRALEAARACRAPEGWWCRALVGFAHHAAGNYVAAETAFDDALATMPEEERCQWTDLSMVLEGDVRGVYRRLACSDRDSLEQRIWWLADPFFSEPGNELRTEHLARHVLNRIQRRAASPEGVRWGKDHREILLRYGWPEGWERIRRQGVEPPGPPPISSHYSDAARYFFPRGDALREPLAIEPDAWELDPDRPRAGHSPGYAAGGFGELAHDVAVFHRGDSAVVVATYHFDDDSVPAEAPIQAALGYTAGEHDQPVIVHTTQGKRGRLAVTVPAQRLLLSVEVVDTEAKRAARARRGVDPWVGAFPALSDLLVLDARDSLPDDLNGAAATAIYPDVYRPGGRIALFWEIYGLGEAVTAVEVSVALRKRSKSIFRRIAELTPLASDRPPLSVGWRDIKPAERDVLARAVAVDLPEKIGDGEYRLELEVRTATGITLTATKRILVRD